MDAATENLETSKIKTSEIMQPGSDSENHDKALQGNMAQVLQVPKEEVIPDQQQPVPQEGALNGITSEINEHVLEPIGKEINPETVGTIGNSTSDGRGGFNIIKGKMAKLFHRGGKDLEKAA